MRSMNSPHVEELDVVAANIGDVRDPYEDYARARREHPGARVTHLGADVRVGVPGSDHREDGRRPADRLRDVAAEGDRARADRGRLPRCDRGITGAEGLLRADRGGATSRAA